MSSAGRVGLGKSGGGGGGSRVQPLVWPTLALLLESAAGALHVDQDGAGSICGTVHGQYQAKTLHGKGCKPCCCARCEEGEADRTANYSSK